MRSKSIEKCNWIPNHSFSFDIPARMSGVKNIGVENWYSKIKVQLKHQTACGDLQSSLLAQKKWIGISRARNRCWSKCVAYRRKSRKVERHKSLFPFAGVHAMMWFMSSFSESCTHGKVTYMESHLLAIRLRTWNVRQLRGKKMKN